MIQRGADAVATKAGGSIDDIIELALLRTADREEETSG